MPFPFFDNFLLEVKNWTCLTSLKIIILENIFVAINNSIILSLELIQCILVAWSVLIWPLFIGSYLKSSHNSQLGPIWSLYMNNLSLRVPFFLRRFLGDRYSSDHIRQRVGAMVDHAFNGDKNSLVEQLSNFCYDIHRYQVLCRSIMSGKL